MCSAAAPADAPVDPVESNCCWSRNEAPAGCCAACSSTSACTLGSGDGRSGLDGHTIGSSMSTKVIGVVVDESNERASGLSCVPRRVGIERTCSGGGASSA